MFNHGPFRRQAGFNLGQLLSHPPGLWKNLCFWPSLGGLLDIAGTELQLEWPKGRKTAALSEG